MDQISNALEPCKQFAKDSLRLVKRCTKPDRKGNEINKTNEYSYRIPYIDNLKYSTVTTISTCFTE